MGLLDILQNQPGWDNGAEADRRQKQAQEFSDAQVKQALLRLADPPMMRSGAQYPTQNPDLSQKTESHPMFKNRDVAQEFQISGQAEPNSPNHPKTHLRTPGFERPEAEDGTNEGEAPYWWPKELL